MSDPEVQIIHHRLSVVEKAVERISEGVQKIAEYTGKLAVLEERHAETRDGLERAFTAIEKVGREHENTEARLQNIEVVMPGLKETRKWVVGGILAIVGMVGLAMVAIVVNTPMQNQVNIRMPGSSQAPTAQPVK